MERKKIYIGHENAKSRVLFNTFEDLESFIYDLKLDKIINLNKELKQIEIGTTLGVVVFNSTSKNNKTFELKIPTNILKKRKVIKQLTKLYDARKYFCDYNLHIFVLKHDDERADLLDVELTSFTCLQKTTINRTIETAGREDVFDSLFFELLGDTFISHVSELYRSIRSSIGEKIIKPYANKTLYSSEILNIIRDNPSHIEVLNRIYREDKKFYLNLISKPTTYISSESGFRYIEVEYDKNSKDETYKVFFTNQKLERYDPTKPYFIFNSKFKLVSEKSWLSPQE